MTTHALHLRLNAVVRRYVWARGLLGVGAAWSLLASAVWLLIRVWQPAGTAWALLCVAIPGVAVGLAFAVSNWARNSRPSLLTVARQIEQLAPSVDARLITAIEQAPDRETGRFTVLQQQVMTEAVATLHGDWPRRLVPTWKLFGSASLIATATGMLAAALWMGGVDAQRPLQARVTPFSADDAAEKELGITVEPGDVEHERGTSLLLIARFRQQLPDRVTLETTAHSGLVETLNMAKALDDPVFGIRIPSVTEDFTYRVEFDGRSTRSYRVTVFDLPLLVRGDLTVQSPDYTGRGEQRFQNAHDVTVVEGSTVVIECRVNKPLATAVLVDAAGAAFPMSRDSQDPLLWRFDSIPSVSQRYRLALTDDRGRQNRDPDQFRVQVVPNQPPKLELTFPGKDVRVSPLEELVLEGRVVDDFGLEEFGMVVAVAGREPQTIPLGSGVKSDKPQNVSLVQALEEWNLVPDDLISYHLYAVDRGPDGELRKTTSDLYFAEVRPFEETFRQMDAPPGGAGQQGGQSPQGNQFEGLVKVQKQIVAATWNLVRNAQSGWSEKQDEQVAVIAESQTTNKSKLLELMTQLQGASQQRSASLAVEQMSAAERDLQKSTEDRSQDPLQMAVAAEQAAYQLLLKLRAREHNVMQSQQSGGGGGGGGASPSEQQLQQLELSDRQNRYESQRAAGQEQSSAQQEELGTLERLKELARRQGDLNQKLRELEAALRLAQSAAEKEEIDRQLKRLRDEQQQLLQDADQLRNRMAQSQRQEDFRETREQLEETRRRMVDATEALQEGQLSQALSSTTRAERELNTLQQEFRQQTSARFAEAMRELREATREAVQRQGELSRELAGNQNRPERPTLRQDRTRQDLQNDFEDQRAAVNELLNRARQVVQDAETAEPLLSQQLYDTLRKTRDDQLEPALEAVPQLLQRGFVPEAQRAETQVREGLERLQAGVNQAAEAVLGNEVEALKRARSEIAELSQQLQTELQQQLQQREGRNGEGTATESGAPNAGTGIPNRQLPMIPRDGGQPAEGEPTREGSSPGSSGQPSSQGERPGETPGSGNSPGQPGESTTPNPEGTPGQSGQPSAAGQGTQPGQGQPAGQGQGAAATPGQGAAPGQGQSPGQGMGQGQNQGQGQPPGSGQGSGSPQSGAPGSPGQPSSGSPLGGQDRGGFGGGPGGQGGPIGGAGFREWADRLRDVESMVSDPDLQAEVAKLREQARSLRAESQRHSVAPNWELVQTSVYQPLLELQRRLSEEVAKRESDDALVPIDRDPVPARYKNLVRSYYERLGRGAE